MHLKTSMSPLSLLFWLSNSRVPFFSVFPHRSCILKDSLLLFLFSELSPICLHPSKATLLQLDIVLQLTFCQHQVENLDVSCKLSSLFIWPRICHLQNSSTVDAFSCFHPLSPFSATQPLVSHQNLRQTAWCVLKSHPIFIRPFLQFVKIILNSTVLQFTENINGHKMCSWSTWFFHFIHPLLD